MRNTDHRAELKKKTVSAVLWSALDAFAKYGVQFVITIFLARLLVPEDFGVISLMMVFIALARVLVDGGFSSALIQRQNLTESEITSVFYLNQAVALIMAALLASAAPWIAKFFAVPELKYLTPIMALNLMISALGVVQTALLTKELDFKTQTHISLISSGVSGGVAVTLAWMGMGVWSLAIQILVASILSTLLLWAWRPWRPHGRFSWHTLRPLFGFGSYILLTDLLNTVYDKLSTMLIGKLYSAKDLGFYGRAEHTQQLSSQFLTMVVNRVTFPIFSTANHDNELLLLGMRKAIMVLMFINLPIMLGLIAVAEPLVLTIYGEKWAPAIPYLEILAFGGILWPLHVVNLSLLKATGRSDIFLKLDLIKKTIGVVSLLVASQFSIEAMAWSLVGVGAISFYINTFYSNKILGYTMVQQLRDVAPYLLVSLVMYAAIKFTELSQLIAPVGVKLIVLICVGVIVYFSICAVFKVPAYLFAKQTLLKR